MLDMRPVSPMKMHARVMTMEHIYGYGSKHAPTAANESQVSEDAEEKVLRQLLAAFPGFSLEVIAAAYTEADSNVNVAAEILSTRQPVIRTLHCTGVQEGRRGPTPKMIQNGYARQSGEHPAVGSDDLLLQKYGSGVEELICRDSKHPEYNHMYRNSQVPSMITSTHPPYVNNQSLSGAWGDGRSSWGGSMSGSESYGVVAGEGVGKKKKKKKKRDGTESEEVEPKEEAGEEFMLSMLGQGFQLGNDVVRDVLGHFEGDIPKSLEVLLQMASSTSGLGLNSDNDKAGLRNASYLDDRKLGDKSDPLHILMGAFPDKDPAQIVMAFQEHNGDVAKVKALLRAGEGVSKNCGQQDATTRKEIDQDHFGLRLLLDQLKALFPAVDNKFLFELLQSTNFVLRDAERVLLDAGLKPAYKHAETPAPFKVDHSIRSHRVPNNHPKVVGEAPVSARPQPLRALWADVKPAITPLEQNWAVLSPKDSRCDNTVVDRKKQTPEFKSYGDFDDYGRHRQCANEHWRTMKYYFTEAAAAYGRGERCRAAVLSGKGKEYKQLAQEANERASQRIFISRNKDIENNITIDLHAQHVDEAVQVLKHHLQSLSCIPSVHTLTVITGHGSHSSNGCARIKPAVTRFLTMRGILWEELNVGCLVIKMKDACNKQLDLTD